MGDATDMNKDQLTRERKNRYKGVMGELVNMILKDGSYLKSNWEKRIKLVIDMTAKLKDPQFVQEWLALLQQSNTSLNQGCANEIHVSRLESNQLNQDEAPQMEGSRFEELTTYWTGSFLSMLTKEDQVSNQLNQNEVLQIEVGALQKAKEESQSINKEINQIMAILEQKGQSMKNLNVYLIIANMLEKVVNSCSSIAAHGILNPDISNLDQGCHGFGSVTFEREEGELRLKFPPIPVHNQEMISQQKQLKKVTLTIESMAGRLAELKLANPEMLDHRLIGEKFDVDIPIDFMDETVTIDNYKVSKCNADPLREILDKYPKIAENFQITNPDSQSYFMNSLAGLYQRIKSEEDMLELKDITNMKLMIQDMEFNGLLVSWLYEMLEEVHERKSLLEVINSSNAKANKAEQERQKAEQERQKAEKRLAKLLKKRKFQ